MVRLLVLLHCFTLVGSSLLLGALSGFALDENAYEAQYASKVTPLLRGAELGSLVAADGHVLSYHVFQRNTPRPAVLLITGYAESWMTHGEVIYELDQAGYDVFLMDHRGMGFSGRLAPNSKIAHITRFFDYVDDVQSFVEKVVRPRIHGPLYLLAHSMGGLVGAYLAEREPQLFRAAVFSAPLFQLNTGNIPEFMAYLVVSLQVARGIGAEFAPGSGDYDPETADPEHCNTTRSAVRCKHQIDLYKEIPETFIAGPSHHWVRTVIRATHGLRPVANAIGTLPMLILQAGNDAFVRLQGQKDFCSLAAHCEMLNFPESFHEILAEKDATRNAAMAAILRFFK